MERVKAKVGSLERIPLAGLTHRKADIELKKRAEEIKRRVESLHEASEVSHKVLKREISV